MSARPATRATKVASAVCVQQQHRQAHAIANPTLANIEKRWESMPPQEQADLWMQLRDRMKVDWKEMTMQEKKAGTYDTHGNMALSGIRPCRTSLYGMLGLSLRVLDNG